MSEQLVYGLHAVSAALNNPHRKINILYVSQDRLDAKAQKLLEQAEKN